MITLTFTGWAAAAATEWILSAVLHFRSGLPVFIVAGIHLLLVLVAQTVGIQAAGHILHRDSYGIASQSRQVAAWFAPLGIYGTAGSIFTIPLAAFASYAMIKVILSLQRTTPADTEINKPLVAEHPTFASLPPRSLSSAAWFFCCGLCTEAGMASTLIRLIGIAVIFVAAAAAIAAYYREIAEPVRSSRQQRRMDFSPALTLLLALILTAGGIGGGGTDQIKTATNAGGEVNGVFLRPDLEPKFVRLVAPPATRSSNAKFAPHVPIRIPFSGVYWYFRSPDVRPPDDAVTAHGSPEWLRFRSTDETPLIMEAHQHLDSVVDLECCSNVDVEIGKIDGDPDPVLLELLVHNSSEPGAPTSLGRQWVAWPAGEHVLHFEIPSVNATPDFDELTVRFEMEPTRNTESARIGIRYLVLVPRNIR